MKNQFMQMALNEAFLAEQCCEMPVGAIVVRNGVVIGKGHNLRNELHDPTLHAEIVAIRQACECISDWRLDDCDIYVTLEPCPMCAGAIINSHIDRVVFGAKDSSAGAFGSIINLTNYPIGFKPKLTGGVLKDDCAEMLRHFFSELRNKKKG